MKSNYLRFSVTDIGDNRDHRRSSNQLKIVSLPTVVIHRFRLFARGTTTRWKSWHKTPKRVSIISLGKFSNGKSAKGTSTQYFLKHGFTLRFATFVNTCHYPYLKSLGRTLFQIHVPRDFRKSPGKSTFSRFHVPRGFRKPLGIWRYIFENQAEGGSLKFFGYPTLSSHRIDPKNGGFEVDN